MEPKSYLTTLTPLRGIAAIVIVVYHSSFMMEQFLPPGYTNFLDNAWLWVDFFFVLSGFIIFYAYGKHFKNEFIKTAYFKYIGARFARIYPLLFVTTIWTYLCSVIIVHFTKQAHEYQADFMNVKALPANLLLVQSMHVYHTPTLNTPSWSLSTEWWVYMLFPFLVPFFSRLTSTGKLLATANIAALYVFIKYGLGPASFYNPGPSLSVMADFGFIRCLAGFCLGMLLYTFYQHRTGYRILKHDWFFVVCVLGLLAAMHFEVADVVIVAFFPFILIAAAYNQAGVKRVLDNRILQRLGDWSFAIYMIHVPIIKTIAAIRVIKHRHISEVAIKKSVISVENTLKADLPIIDYRHGTLMCIILVVLTFAMAPVFYRFVEIPARNYFNRLFNTRKVKISNDSLMV